MDVTSMSLQLVARLPIERPKGRTTRAQEERWSFTMRQTPQLYEQFEELIGKLYIAEGYTRLDTEESAYDRGFDLLLRSPQGERVAIEVKLHRTATINRGRVMEMLRRAAGVKLISNVDRVILVIGSKMGIPFSDTFGVELVDLPKIMEMAARHPDLLPTFEALFREVLPRVTTEEYLVAHMFGDAVATLQEHSDRIIQSPEIPRAFHDCQEPLGEVLTKAIRGVPAGKRGARQFEIKVLDALRYIFKDDLSGWSEQQVTRNGLSRYDVIARTSSEHDVWRSIVVFFKSWYVVFEFKNHSKPVTQKEITSTEKYLYAGAMRMVAFIISQKGGAENALEMARGALREHGKLIVNLSVADLCEMIRMKDESNDPNAFLYDIFDGMLMRLER
jgi:Restriction endonuclease